MFFDDVLAKLLPLFSRNAISQARVIPVSFPDEISLQFAGAVGT